jgi:hypothetical protein
LSIAKIRFDKNAPLYKNNKKTPILAPLEAKFSNGVYGGNKILRDFLFFY